MIATTKRWQYQKCSEWEDHYQDPDHEGERTRSTNNFESIQLTKQKNVFIWIMCMTRKRLRMKSIHTDIPRSIFRPFVRFG